MFNTIVDLSFMTTAELTTLRDNATNELKNSGGRSIVSTTSGDVSVAKQFGVTLDLLLRSIAYEYQKRGLSTARTTRTRVQFS